VQFASASEAKSFRGLVEEFRKPPENLDSVLFWRNLPPSENLPSLVHPAGARIGNRAYFFGGTAENLPSNTFVELNLEDFHVEVSTPAIPGRVGHTLSMVRESLYLIGGENGEETLIWKDGHWSVLKDSGILATRAFHSAAVWNSWIAVFGGVRDSVILNDLAVLNTETANWREFSAPCGPCPRRNASAVVIDDRLILHGGRDLGGVFSDLFIFTFSTEQWQQVTLPGAELPARCGHVCIPLGGSVVLLGGFSNESKPAPSVYLNMNSLMWNEFTSAGNCQTIAFSGAIETEDGKIVIYGGSDISTSTAGNGIFVVSIPSKLEFPPMDAKIPTVVASKSSTGSPRPIFVYQVALFALLCLLLFFSSY
jgi:hypothetical protein